MLAEQWMKSLREQDLKTGDVRGNGEMNRVTKKGSSCLEPAFTLSTDTS
jgi:hypothetical protein